MCDYKSDIVAKFNQSKSSYKMPAESFEILSSTLPKAVPLIKTGYLKTKEEFILDITTEADCTLCDNFDKTKKMCIIVSAGVVGVGKSTWNNALLYALNRQTDSPFEVGDTQVTQTEGLWFYPQPVYHKSAPDTQILLLDMEGMSGIRHKIDPEKTKIMLQKLYLAGMATSSVFCVHTNNRPTAHDIQTIKDMFEILNELKSNLGIEVPKIYMFVKEATQIKTKAGGAESYEQYLQETYGLPQELMSLIKIVPRQNPPEDYRMCQNYKKLEGSAYFRTIEDFLQEALQFPKRNPGLQSYLKLDNLHQFFNLLKECINSTDFQQNFLTSLEKRLAEIAHPRMQQVLNEYQKEIRSIAENMPVSKSEAEFDATAEQLKKQYSDRFKMDLSQIFKREISSSDMLKEILSLFRNSMNDQTAKMLYLQRKIDAENDQKRKAELEKIKKDSEMKNQELTMKVMQGEQNLKDMQQQYKKQDEKRQAEFEATISAINNEKAQLQSELNEMKKDSQRFKEEIKQYSQKIDDLNQTNEGYENRLAEMKREFQNERNRMLQLQQEQDERHKEQNRRYQQQMAQMNSKHEQEMAGLKDAPLRTEFVPVIVRVWPLPIDPCFRFQ